MKGVQRAGAAAFVAGALLQVPAILASGDLADYWGRIRWCRPGFSYSQSCEYMGGTWPGVWLMIAGAVAWLVYPLIAWLVRWVRAGGL